MTAMAMDVEKVWQVVVVVVKRRFSSLVYYLCTYLAGDFLSEVGEVHLSGRLLLTAVTPVFHHCILCRAPSELWKFLTI